MKCPVCHHNETKVIDSRAASEGFSIRRRRECLKCTFRFSTYEEIEILDLKIIKTDNTTESYSRVKLTKGLRRATEKRPITEEDFKKLISNIERDIQALGKNKIKSNQVGQIIMKHLHKLDKIAYIRFASVYKCFEDLEEFNKELNKLIKKRN